MKLLKPWTWFGGRSFQPLDCDMRQKPLQPYPEDLQQLVRLCNGVRLGRELGLPDEEYKALAAVMVHVKELLISIERSEPVTPGTTYSNYFPGTYKSASYFYSDLAQLDSWVTVIRNSRWVSDKNAEDAAWRRIVELTEGKTLLQKVMQTKARLFDQTAEYDRKIQTRLDGLEKNSHEPVDFGPYIQRIEQIENILGIKRTV